jgi:hypothetical protein
LSPLWGPFVLINLGCSLRVFGQTATDMTAGAFPIAGVSGLFEVTGLALWGAHLWLVMSGRARLRCAPQQAEAAAWDGSTPIAAHHTVGAVLERSPELLDVFLHFGFTTLANPQLRRTIARVVTIEKACRRMGVNEAEFLSVLNRRLARAGVSRDEAACDSAREKRGDEAPVDAGNTCRHARSRLTFTESSPPESPSRMPQVYELSKW